MIAINYHVVNGCKSEPFDLDVECKTEKELNTLWSDLRRKHGAKKIQKGSRFVYEPEIFINTSEAPEQPKVITIDKDHKPFEPTSRPVGELIRFNTVRSYLKQLN